VIVTDIAGLAYKAESLNDDDQYTNNLSDLFSGLLLNGKFSSVVHVKFHHFSLSVAHFRFPFR